MKDPEIEEIRAARHAISAEHDHDLHAVVEYYRSYEQELRASGRFKFEDSPAAKDRRGVKEEDDLNRQES